MSSDDPTKTTTSGPTEAEKTDAAQKRNNLKKEEAALDKEALKTNDAVYERIVANIEKAREAYEIKKVALEALKQESDLLQAQLVLQDSILNNLGQEADKQASLLELLDSQNLKEERKAEIEAEIKLITDQREVSLKEINLLANEYGLSLKLQSEEGEGLLATINDQTKSTKERLAALKEFSKYSESDKATTKATLDMQQKMDKVSKKVTDNFGISSKTSETMLGGLESMTLEAGKLAGDGKGFGLVKKMMGKSLGQSLNFKNALFSAFEESFKIAVQIEKISKELGKATGFGNVFATQIRDVGNNLTLLGGSEETAGKVITAMTQGLSSFNPEVAKTNKRVATTIGKLEILGVSASASVKTIDHLQRTMGMTAEQAADATAQMARMGKEIGISGTKMINDFNSASGRLAIYGKNNVKVFKGLAAAAKATGIEMQSLISISKGFDTFDKAADSAAQLNAVLGTQLSTIDLMNASDEERIMMIKQQVQASVGNFDSLDKFTKQYVAQAMGVSDVAEAQRLLNMSTAEYQQMQAGQQEQADIQKELAEASAELVPTMQKLGILGMKFFRIFTPFINGFLLIGEYIDVAYSKMAGFLEGMSGALSTLGTILKYVLTAIALIIAVAGGFVSGPIAILMAFVAVLGAIYDWLHKDGSPMLYQMFDFIAGAVGRMAAAFVSPITMVKGLTDAFKSMFGALHDKNASQSFDIAAVANIDMNKVAAGISNVKSALMELSTLKIDGFLAMTTDGSSTSMIMGSEGLIKQISDGKLTVDVKMPDLKMPDINVKVFIGNTELRDIIRTEVSSVVGAAG